MSIVRRLRISCLYVQSNQVEMIREHIHTHSDLNTDKKLTGNRKEREKKKEKTTKEQNTQRKQKRLNR